MYKGETYLDTGTPIELAKKYHVKLETMIWLTEPVAHKRSKGNKTLLYPAEDVEDD